MLRKRGFVKNKKKISRKRIATKVPAVPKKEKPETRKKRKPVPARDGRIPSSEVIELVIRAQEGAPFRVLGPHPSRNGRTVVVSAFLPLADKAWVRPLHLKGKPIAMKKIHPQGFFQAEFKKTTGLFSYTLVTCNAAGSVKEGADPYAFFPDQLTDYDLHLIGEGTHYRSYEKFGARLLTLKGVSGVLFTVWAPHAKNVSVVGGFNHWIAGAHPMTRLSSTGVWCLFIPGLGEGELYKFAIRSGRDGRVLFKADPYAFGTELRPGSAAVVTRLDTYT